MQQCRCHSGGGRGSSRTLSDNHVLVSVLYSALLYCACASCVDYLLCRHEGLRVRWRLCRWVSESAGGAEAARERPSGDGRQGDGCVRK